MPEVFQFTKVTQSYLKVHRNARNMASKKNFFKASWTHRGPPLPPTLGHGMNSRYPLALHTRFSTVSQSTGDTRFDLQHLQAFIYTQSIHKLCVITLVTALSD
jgi:hypothetical protein